MKLLPPDESLAVSRVAAPPSAAWFSRLDALLLMVDAERVDDLAGLPWGALLRREHARLKCAPGRSFALTLPTPRGLRVVVGVRPASADAFQSLTLAGRMLRDVGAARPAVLGLATLAAGAADEPVPAEALLAAVLAATERRPQQKSKPAPAWRPRVLVSGAADVRVTTAVESGAHLARWLTQLPPNILGPGAYRRALATLARRHRWRMHVYGEATLRRLGAGAFTAVARGSARRDAALVRLEYRPRSGAAGRRAPIALVGKGLCFDTGGLNLKPPKSMLDMHGDMAGSAVAVGILLALTASGYPHPVDAWLALAENRIGPDSYTQQDVVTAANGTTIQVVHTDAEGRMVLADTLALASRTRPSCIVDFATLTGACVTALTERLSRRLHEPAPAARRCSRGPGGARGERVWNFPMPEDFDEDLDSPVADIVQCLMDGKGDHIYAARFLSRFVGAGIPWVHVDLSAAERAGGLAHVPSPTSPVSACASARRC